MDEASLIVELIDGDISPSVFTVFEVHFPALLLLKRSLLPFRLSNLKNVCSLVVHWVFSMKLYDFAIAKLKILQILHKT